MAWAECGGLKLGDKVEQWRAVGQRPEELGMGVGWGLPVGTMTLWGTILGLEPKGVEGSILNNN